MLRLQKSSAQTWTYESLYMNPLTELKQERSRTTANLNRHLCGVTAMVCEKENNGKLAKARWEAWPNGKRPSKSALQCRDKNSLSVYAPESPSLQFCIQMNEAESRNAHQKSPNSNYVWDESDAEAAPAPSWSTLPNRSLLCRPLPPDIGRCTCYIVRERAEGLDQAFVYSLYTNEGHGRQDRKLAVARHRRRGGRSEFVIAQSCFGILSKSDEGYLGMVTANLLGSRYHIWDQGNPLVSRGKDSRQLLGAVTFVPTVTTLTGNFRSMKVCIPKPQSIQTRNTTQHVNDLPSDWEENMDNVHQLFSTVPYYNKNNRRYELDFRDRTRPGLRIRTSAKNFQLAMEENSKQSILLLAKIGKSKYIMDYRSPMTGYQAFCICLACMDSKLCCSV